MLARVEAEEEPGSKKAKNLKKKNSNGTLKKVWLSLILKNEVKARFQIKYISEDEKVRNSPFVIFSRAKKLATRWDHQDWYIMIYFVKVQMLEEYEKKWMSLHKINNVVRYWKEDLFF